MVKYECFRCGYVASQRINLRHHLNRKNICNPVEEDIGIDLIKKYYGFDDESKMTPNHSKITPNHSKITPNHSKITPNESKNITPNNSKSLHFEPNITPNNSKSLHFENNKPTCEYCLRSYTRIDNLTKHLKTCKIKKEQEILVINQNEKIIKMEKEIEELKNYKIQTQNNTTNTTNNNNSHNTINNTIHINNYGNENLKHLKSKDFIGLLNGIYSAVPKLIEKIHFDPKHPENQNIKYPNMKLPYLKIMKDDKWQFVDKKDELLDLIDAKCYMLKEKYYAILEKKKYNITEVQRNKIEEFMKKYHEDEKQTTIELLKRTELMLLNNKNISIVK